MKGTIETIQILQWPWCRKEKDSEDSTYCCHLIRKRLDVVYLLTVCEENIPRKIVWISMFIMFWKLQKVAFFRIFGFMYLSVNMIGKLPRKKVENSVEKKVKVRGRRQKHYVVSTKHGKNNESSVFQFRCPLLLIKQGIRVRRPSWMIPYRTSLWKSLLGENKKPLWRLIFERPN